MTKTYIRYSDSVEQIPEDEAETIDKIMNSMHRSVERASEGLPQMLRASHAKSHGLATGELEVLDGLPEELRQGLFARPGIYPIVARLANVPGEITKDAVNTQRGLAFKVFGTRGEVLPGHNGQTQDFVLDTGNRFPAATAKQFLATHLGLEHASQMPAAIKEAVSAVSRVTNKALHAVGLDSANLDFFGHDHIHPLAEAYFSQAPLRYGDYIAKLAVVPVSAAQKDLADKTLGGDDPDRLRTATVGFLRDHDAIFEVRVQLCTDLEDMPVENANKEWSEEKSSYRTVAILRIPKQDAYAEGRRDAIERLSFCVSHSLAAHRPLGGIQRARLRAYPEMSRMRRQANNQSLSEPQSIDEVFSLAN